MAVRCVLVILTLIANYHNVLCDVSAIFLLSTPENPNIANRQEFSYGMYDNISFIPTRIYKVLCHGWTESENITWYTDIIPLYMKINVNVISIGYYKAVANPLYVTGALHVKALGKLVGKTITNLIKTKEIPPDNFHFIGFSLGAHVAGIAAETIKSLTTKTIARLTGLDPAWPGFDIPFLPYNPKNRFSKDDAKFVDVIHTSILGIRRHLGHVDVYPNGGLIQSGCKHFFFCDHPMSVVIYLLSLMNELPQATKCSSYFLYRIGFCPNTNTTVGEFIDQSERGLFYLDTDPKITKGYFWLFTGPNLDFRQIGA